MGATMLKMRLKKGPKWKKVDPEGPDLGPEGPDLGQKQSKDTFNISIFCPESNRAFEIFKNAL